MKLLNWSQKGMENWSLDFCYYCNPHASVSLDSVNEDMIWYLMMMMMMDIKANLKTNQRSKIMEATVMKKKGR